MTQPGYRTKRLLSPESANLQTLQTPIEKKQRHKSSTSAEFNLITFEMNEEEIVPRDLQAWMAMISKQLKTVVCNTDLEDLATKQDLQNMNDSVVAQGEEIKQIRDELTKYKKDFDALRISFDEAEARNLHRKYSTADSMGQSNVNNMADRRRIPPFGVQSTRKNLVIEGLKGQTESDMIASLLHITSELGAIVYKVDIDTIFRMNRRDETNRSPGPVLVKFHRISVRDSILKRKINLRHMDEMKMVYINADEPLEVRRTKAVYRKIAAIATRKGEDVELRYDYIKIGGVTYTLDELHKIPVNFLPQRSDEPQQAMAAASASSIDTTEIPTTNPEKAMTPGLKPELIRTGEKMRLVEAGLLFSGPSAYPSNMAYAPVRYDSKDYISNEQAFQHTKAVRHNQPELAASLKEMTNSYAIKVDASEIVTSEDWNKSAPELLWDLFDRKMKRNPELLERLIETAPHRLIEASTSTRWGGRAPFESRLYDTGKFTGKNEFGDMATGYRDMKIQERSNNMLT